MSDFIRFAILATPRTGSNWLCTLLDSHRSILCHHEIFNPDDIGYALSSRKGQLNFGSLAQRDREPLKTLDKVWIQPLGHDAIGFKLNQGQNDSVLDNILNDKDVVKIIIRRANRLRAFISARIAEVTGEWESYPWQDLSGPTARVHVNMAVLWQQIARTREYYAHLDDCLRASGQVAFKIDYESLGDSGIHQSLLNYLSVDPSVELIAATRKQNSGDIKHLIDNFDEVRSAINGTELERDLDAPDYTSTVGGVGY